MEYKIVDAEIPKTPNPNAKNFCRFPFKELDVGKSFFVPNRANRPADIDFVDSSYIENMRTHVSRHNRFGLAGKDKKFSCRLWPDNPQFIQVWRVS